MAWLYCGYEMQYGTVCPSMCVYHCLSCQVNLSILFVPEDGAFSALWEATAFSYGRERVAIASTVFAVFDGSQTQEL